LAYLSAGGHGRDADMGIVHAQFNRGRQRAGLFNGRAGVY